MPALPLTLLFTDLANSAELLQRADDEQAQRIFQAHHRLLKRFVAAHGGQDVRWLGDGSMTVFASGGAPPSLCGSYRRPLRAKRDRFIVSVMSSRPQMRVLGRHIVSDSRICHGKPTFRGTRVRVEDVLEQVASGMAWETIIEDWNRSVTVEAIREAVQLASQALAKHADEFVLATKSA